MFYASNYCLGVNLMFRLNRQLAALVGRVGGGYSVRIEEVLASEETDYQLLEIFRGEGFGKMLALDGKIQLAESDEFIYHEMFVHVPCFSHPEPENVLVIGGGDTGSDCIGTARRQGAESILQIELMPEPPAERSPSTPWPEFPYMRRDSSSHAEGVERLWSVNSSAFEGRDGAVTALQACRIQWSLNEKGRPQTFRALEDGAFRIETDLVLLAMGFTGVRADEGIVKEFSLSVEKGRIVTDPDMRSSDPRVFVAGDSASGASLVVRAIASGRRCAASVNRILQKGGLAGK